MPLSDAIRTAVDATFPVEQRTQVIDGLATIPADRGDAEVLQAAVVVLSYGDLAIFEMQLMNARIEPRDVIYVVQSPCHIHPDLTQGELVRRYRELRLPIPIWLDQDA